VRSFYDWMRGHPLVVDSLLALAVALFGLSAFGVRPGRFAVTLLFILAISAPVALRRRYPVGAFVAVLVVGGIQVLTLPRPFGADLAVVILLYTVAAYRPRRVSAVALAACLAGSMVALVAWAPPPVVHSLWSFAVLGAVFAGPAVLAWLLGDSMQWRRGYYRSLEERAARLERERDARAQIAVAAERARIARELHDVVAHHVSVMVVQADGATFALETSPARTRDALTAISRTGRQALTEMRRLLGVLRSADDEGGQLEPQPGVEQLGGLLEQARAAGLPVSFAVEGVPRPLPAGAALAAYRIVQESLTNARKHGGPAVTAAVALRFCEDQLVIKVTDDGRRRAGAVVAVGAGTGARVGAGGVTRGGAVGSGALGGGALGSRALDSGALGSDDGQGHGLIGMRERVEVYGGTVTAGPCPGGWRVTATLPMPAEPGAA
jgi:signal transduction histidine kinase